MPRPHIPAAILMNPVDFASPGSTVFDMAIAILALILRLNFSQCNPMQDTQHGFPVFTPKPGRRNKRFTCYPSHMQINWLHNKQINSLVFLRCLDCMTLYTSFAIDNRETSQSACQNWNMNPDNLDFLTNTWELASIYWLFPSVCGQSHIRWAVNMLKATSSV